MRWIGLVVWLGLCFGAAALGSSFTVSQIPAWYQTLVRPAIAPPNWVFGPVWTLLYTLMAVAAWRVWLTPPSPMRTWGLALFLAQLVLNFAWSWLFFGRHAMGAALAEIVLLWAAIAASSLAFTKTAPLAAWLMVPYLAWVSFAALLNEEFWRLNRG